MVFVLFGREQAASWFFLKIYSDKKSFLNIPLKQ